MKEGKAKIIIREHNGFKEWKNLVAHYEKEGKKVPVRQYFGQYQFLFQTRKGLISIVQLWDIMQERWYWELGLFYKTVAKIQITERFATFEDAQERAWEFLL